MRSSNLERRTPARIERRPTPRLVIEVHEVDAIDDQTVEAFGRLIPQLSTSSAVPTAAYLRRMLESDATVLFAARQDDVVVGLLTLVIVRIPTGIRARIEDVVVDESARGQGIGARLSHAAIERAAQEGVRTVDLTSRPSRVAANRLYERLGFQERETRVYRYQLD
jgi:ribosomal protein S18 acetylase RimI-like enzyme